MPRLVITHKKNWLSLSLPHYIIVNGHVLGVMKTPSVSIEAPKGTFEVRIQSMFKWFYSSTMVTMHDGAVTHIDMSDRERWWDILFVVDIILWCVKRLLNLTAPWTWIYEIFTNGYFVAWLIYEWTIRKHYFRLDVYGKPDKESPASTDADGVENKKDVLLDEKI